MSPGGRPEGRGTEGAELGAVWGGTSPPQPTREYVERRELPNGVRNKAPAANAFSGYSRPQNASRRKKKKSFSVKFSSMNY